MKKWIRKRWLIFIVFFVRWFQVFGILPPVWYKSEIELAKIKGEELYNFFKDVK